MTVWVLIVGGAALIGAFSLWHTFTHVKHESELMLGKYRHMLEEARRARAEAMAEALEGAFDDDGTSGGDGIRRV